MQNSSKFETRGMQSQTRSSRRQLHRRAYPGPADHHEVAVPSKARKGGLLGAAATYYVPRKRLREFLLEAGRVQKAERHVTRHTSRCATQRPPLPVEHLPCPKTSMRSNLTCCWERGGCLEPGGECCSEPCGGDPRPS